LTLEQGYAPNGYRLWLLEERKVVVGHDVIFDETTFPSPYGNANTADREADTEKEDAEEEDTEEKKLEKQAPDEDEEDNWNDATETPGAKTQKDALVELKGSPSTSPSTLS
jgi:hypothetical protein